MRQGRLITTGLAAIAALAIAPAAAGAAPGSFVDDAASDFGSGGLNTVVTAPGSVQLARVMKTENFDGSALPTGYASSPWAAGGGATVSGGAVTVDAARVDAPRLYDAGQVLEFTATFSGDSHQHVGFGQTFEDGQPWAIFSTLSGGQLMARTQNASGATPTNTPLLTIADPFAEHAYRIEWSAAEVKFFVDNTQVASHTISIATQMHPAASDAAIDAGNVKLNSLGLSLHADSGQLVSRVHDAGRYAVWGQLSHVISGTAGAASFETRSGNTATPDASWSAYQPLAAGGAVQSPSGRYIQYRMTLNTTDDRVTPSLDRVELTHETDESAPTTTIGSAETTGGTGKITFSSGDADVARFECSLDGGAFSPCTSPKEFGGLSAGSHTIAVRAVDKAGNVGAAVSRTVTVAGSGGPGGPGGGPGVDTKAPIVSLSSRKLRASTSGKVKLKLTCPDDETSCKLTVRLKDGRKTYALTSDTLSGGETSKLTLRLSSKARRKLARHGRLSLKAVVGARDADGNRKKSKYSVTLRPR